MRLRFLDAARCLAIVVMVVAHARDGLLSAAGNAHWLARLHDHTRGYTAPLFFIVSGWAFAAATVPRWRSWQTWGTGLRGRLARCAALFVIGKLLTLPWWHEAFPFEVPREVWLPFTTSGVLECLAVAMLAAHAGLFAARGARTLAAGLVAAAVAAVLLAPATQSATEGWPLFARGIFNADGVGGGFPLLPFAAYFWFGAALGTVAVSREWTSRECALAAVALAAVLLGAAHVLEGGATSPRLWVASPGLFMLRAGWVLVTLAVLAAALERVPRQLSLERVAGRALTFYVGHMLLLWGVPFVPGLVHRVQHGLEVGGVALVAALMLTVLAVFCFATERSAPQPMAERTAEG